MYKHIASLLTTLFLLSLVTPALAGPAELREVFFNPEITYGNNDYQVTMRLISDSSGEVDDTYSCVSLYRINNEFTQTVMVSGTTTVSKGKVYLDLSGTTRYGRFYYTVTADCVGNVNGATLSCDLEYGSLSWDDVTLDSTVGTINLQ